MISAAGILYFTPAGHILMCRRTDDKTWAFPGGGIEEGETAEDAARREFEEETGQNVGGKLRVWTRRVRDGVDFTTFVAQGPEFVPALNDEHISYQWTDRELVMNAASRLHPGVLVSLARFDMDELGVARAMAAGELTSPQQYGNILLTSIRITGTGASYRSNGDEYVWRDAAIYMTEEFLDRCNGLPVIMLHPEDKPMLDSIDFRRRIVGTVFLPFLKHDEKEVWAIAKILEEQTAELLATEQMSTSPCVVFIGKDGEGVTHTLHDGAKLLVEDRPYLLDHIAICPTGVWDKGGPPSGVDSIDTRADVTDQLDEILAALKIDEAVRLISRATN